MKHALHDNVVRALESAAEAGMLDRLVPEGYIADLLTTDRVNIAVTGRSPFRPPLDDLIGSYPSELQRPPTSSCLVIGIAGGSGSGKTYLAERLREIIPERYGLVTSVIAMDDYYVDRSDITLEERAGINYDEPIAFDRDLLAEHLSRLINGEMVERPTYDFTTHTRLPTTSTILPSRVLIVEGTMLFAIPELVDMFHLRVYRRCPPELRRERRLKRDVERRGRTLDSVERRIEQHVLPGHKKYVRPSAQHADLIISQARHMEDVPEAAVAAVVGHLLAISEDPSPHRSRLSWKKDGTRRFETQTLSPRSE